MSVKVYVAGPMRGLAEHNFPAFIEASEYLRGLGYDVTGPHELDLDDDPEFATKRLEPHMTTKWFMQRDLPLLLACDGIVLLPGWEESEGARIELTVAAMAGMRVYHYLALRKEH